MVQEKVMAVRTQSRMVSTVLQGHPWQWPDKMKPCHTAIEVEAFSIKCNNRLWFNTAQHTSHVSFVTPNLPKLTQSGSNKLHLSWKDECLLPEETNLSHPNSLLVCYRNYFYVLFLFNIFVLLCICSASSAWYLSCSWHVLGTRVIAIRFKT